ncbi:MAG TPA: DNA topoisomerase VI subunit B [Candidatus Nitrosocosmicus sp.]|nr:DNA topoisomerase VI subunit B [Candidatus Nitrosocosmicus sp.]
MPIKSSVATPPPVTRANKIPIVATTSTTNNKNNNKATITATTTATTPAMPKTDHFSLNSSNDKFLKKEENIQLSNLEKYKIIYNKKAESEFFVDNSALAGFTGERILYMAVRELIENSLDSCESFSILPSINVSLKTFDQVNDLWMLSCEDNGTGINSDKVPVAVCSFLTSAKYMEKQQRGLFGVGLKMVAAFSTKDTDFPIKVWNRSIDESDEYYFELRTDIGTNKPIVLSKKLLKGIDAHIKSTSGFKIEVILRAKLMPITKSKIYEYVSETSIVNPYASITFETDDGVFHFDKRTSIMPQPAQEILPHPSDMDLKTLKKAISKFQTQKMSLPKILSASFQKLSYEKAKDIVTNAGLSLKTATIDFSEHDLIKVVNICKKTRFQNPNTDHLSPIGENVLTIGMMSEYTIVSSKGNDALSSDNLGSQRLANKLESSNSVANATISTASNIATDKATGATPPPPSSSSSEEDEKNTPPILLNEDKRQHSPPNPEKLLLASPTKNNTSKSNFSVKVLKPVLTTYTSRTCVINNRPTIVETGLAYGGDIPSFKMYRFANKIPLLYDEGSDVAREVISEVEINKMGITKKQAKEQFSTASNKESKKDRVIEVLPLHIFFHICSTKIPYKTAGKESIASEGELKYYMKSCLSELYRKLSTQIRKELKLKEAENKLRLYKHYLPFIVDSINESLGIKNSKLNDSFSKLIENHLSKRPLIDESEVSEVSSPAPPSTSYFSSNSSSPPLMSSLTTSFSEESSLSNSASLSPSSSLLSSSPPSPGSSSHSNKSSSSSSSLSSNSRSSAFKSTKSKSVTPGMESRSLPQIDHKDEKKNQILKSNKQEKENFISKARAPGNDINVTKKKINKSFSQSYNKTKQSKEFTKDLKLKVKGTEKKTVSKERKPLSSNKIKNKSNILKKDIIKIKIQKSPNKMNINKVPSAANRIGSGRGTRGVTNIPSSLPSQSKQFQSTMDTFNKRVNKGKRK